MNDTLPTADSAELVNIGPREVRKRLVMGVVMIATGATAAVAFSYAGINRGWYSSLFVPFWMGMLGLFQARKKT